MAESGQINVVGFDGTYVYGIGTQALTKRNASTLAAVSIVSGLVGTTAQIGYMPFDGTYLYVPYNGGIDKVEVSSMSVVATYASPTGDNCYTLSFDGTYLYATFYDTTAAYSTLYKVDASTMTLVSSLTGLVFRQILAPSLKYAVSPIL